MQHLPSEDPSSQASNPQGLEVNKSNLTNSPVGQAGGSVNQAGGDINYFFNSVPSDLSADKIEKLRKFERNLKREFQEKLNEAALTVNDLRACVEHRLTDGNPKDDATILRLLDELQSTLGKESRLKLINADLEFCHEGGLWLRENKHRLARFAKDHVFQQHEFSRISESLSSNLTYQELEERFLQDMETYIAWIGVYLRTGTTPQATDFNDGVRRVYLDLPESVYKSAFEALNSEFIDPSVSGLSTGAANNTASYFNRFIVDRDLGKDAKRHLTKRLSKTFSVNKSPLSKIVLLLLAVLVAAAILIMR